MNIAITGKNFEVDSELETYVSKKINKLAKYVPKHAKKTAHASVTLTQEKSKKKESFQAEIILVLPHGELVAKDSTVNMYAAVDIVEAKIKNQLRKYKSTHSGRSSDKREVLTRVRKIVDRDFWGRQN